MSDKAFGGRHENDFIPLEESDVLRPYSRLH